MLEIPLLLVVLSLVSVTSSSGSRGLNGGMRNADEANNCSLITSMSQTHRFQSGLWFDDAFGVRLSFGDRNMTFHIWECGVTLTLSPGGWGGNVGSWSAHLFAPLSST